MSWKSVLVWVVVVAAGVGAAASGASAARRAATPRVPYGFVGMVIDQGVWPNPQVDLSQQLDVMAATGVDSVRAVFDWSDTQPYASWSKVPADQRDQFVDVQGLPTNFTDLDAIVALTAEHGMTLLPIVMNAPSWAGENFRRGLTAIPRRPGPYAAFVMALALRYGSNGSFWRDNPQIPRLPVEMWQIWNEPNVYPFWPQGPQPWYRGYIALLRAAHSAIKRADPRAQVVLAGLPNYSWIALKRIVTHGGRNLFDVAAIHPYTRTPEGVITILRYARNVLNQTGGAHKPILADEISWGSSLGDGHGPGAVGLDIATTRTGQARKIGELLPMLARERRSLGLAGFDYYTWAASERPGSSVFEFSGLFKVTNYQFVAKPAYGAFRAAALAMEGCRSKGPRADECVR